MEAKGTFDMTGQQRDASGVEIGPTTTIKVPAAHWVGIFVLIAGVGSTWAGIVSQARYNEEAIKELRQANVTAIQELKTSLTEQANARIAAIERHREIIDRLTLVAERLSIKQEVQGGNLDDAIKRIRDIERTGLRPKE